MPPITLNVSYLETSQLVPKEWADGNQLGYVFNPTICQADHGLSMIYRVVNPDSDIRRIAACRIDANLFPVPGSVVPLSDLIEFVDPNSRDTRALNWHADPRVFCLNGELFVTWNDGSAQPSNHQFMTKLDSTGTRPDGLAREIVTKRNRRPIEKNWMFFCADDKVWCTYSAFPHDVMSVDMRDPEYVVCTPAYSTLSRCEYESLFGVVRGGAQPIDLGDRFLTLAHSSYKMSDTLRYYACMVYEIARTAPFAVTRCANVPFTLPSDQDSGSFSLAKLNPAVGSVIYPCGIVRVGEDVLITYGINDERAAIARMPLQSLLDMLVPVKVATSRSTANFTLRHDQRTQVSKYVPGLFWWNAVQKSFDGKFGNRNFSIGNFGDIASRDIVERVSGLTTRCCTVGGPKLLAVGSIMHNARDGDVVWGSGVKGTHRTMHESVKTLDVRAVRGPLSADTLRSQGFDMSKVSHVFDPGCLVAHLFASEIAAYDVGRNDHLGSIRVVPHYRDDIFFRRMYPEHVRSFISVDDTPQGMVEKMLGAEAVFSSSLHGIVFAESLGIPAYWLTPHGGEDTFKYYDYYYSTNRYNVKSFDSLHEAMKTPALPTPTFDVHAYLATFPHDRMRSLSQFGLSAPADLTFGSMTRMDIEGSGELEWSAIRHNSEGLTVMGSQAQFRIAISSPGETGSYLTLELGRTKSSLGKRFGVEIKVAGHPFAVIDLDASEEMLQSVEVFIPATFSGHYVDVSLGCTKSEKAMIILKRACLTPASVADFHGLPDISTRAEQRAAAVNSARDVLVESPMEWLVGVGKLEGLAGFSAEQGNKYVRLFNRAEMKLPDDVVGNAKLIYLAGPSLNFGDAGVKLWCLVNTQRIAVDLRRQPKGSGWTARVPLGQLSLRAGELVRVQFVFDDEAQGSTGSKSKHSLLVRKISFGKHRSDIAEAVPG